MPRKKPVPVPETTPPAPKKPAKRSRKGGKAVSSDTADNCKPEVGVNGTPKKKARGKPFSKGKDPRRNIVGRPRGFDEARKMMIGIMGETVQSPDGKIKKSRVEIMMMDWVTSRNFQKQKAAFELAYGKGNDNILATLDLNALTNSQLQRLAKGEDVYSVIMKPS